MPIEHDHDGAIPLHAGGANNNAPFAHSTSLNDMVEYDSDLEDLDDIDYDAIVVKDARMVRVLELRPEGNKLVLVEKGRNAEAGPSHSYVEQSS